MATIRKMGNGWQAICKKKGHKTRVKTFQRRTAAVIWGRDTDVEMGHPAYTDPSRTPLSGLLRWYLGRFTPNKRTGAREPSRIRLLMQEMGAQPAETLTPNLIVEFCERRLAVVGSDTVRKELNPLSAVLDAAIALKGLSLPSNPAVMARRILRVTKALKRGVERDRRLTAGEEKALLASPIGPLVQFAVSRGMRRGELAAQRREHRRGCFLRIPETKTDEARTIPLTTADQALLDGLPAQIDGSIWGLTADAMTRKLARVCAKAGIEDLRFHDLRHEAISRMFEAGMSIQEVAAITGHRTWTQLRRYTHLSKDYLAGLADQAEA